MNYIFRFQRGNPVPSNFLKLADEVFRLSSYYGWHTCPFYVNFSRSKLKQSSRFKGCVFLFMFLHGRPLDYVFCEGSSPGAEPSSMPCCACGAWTVAFPAQPSRGLFPAGFLGQEPYYSLPAPDCLLGLR